METPTITEIMATEEPGVPVAAKLMADDASSTATPTEEDSVTEEAGDQEGKDLPYATNGSVEELPGLVSSPEASPDEENQVGPMLRATREGLAFYDLKYAERPPDATNGNRILITFSVRCASGMCEVVIIVREEERKFSYYLKAPTMVPEALRSDAALYLSRVNYGLVIGNFELDLSDGEVRFKCASHVPGSELSTEMVKYAVASAVSMMDRFFPGLMAVLYGGKDPKAAYDNCTKDTNEDQQQAQ